MRVILLLIVIFLPLNGSFAQGLSGIISINDGAAVTNDPEGRVMLKIFAKGAAEMRISNNGSFIGAKWEQYDMRKNWRVDAREDGIRTVYAQFRDLTGAQVSDVAIAQIEIDRTPPTNPSLIIGGGIEAINNPERKVMLEIFAEDASEMRVSNRNDFVSARWYPYRTRIEGWILTGGDGEKHVFVQFKDRAGNVSDIASDTIYFDATPPGMVSIKINHDALFTQTPDVKLQLVAEGSTHFMIMGASDWVPFESEVDFTLPEGTGEKIVAVKFKDKAGNESRAVGDKIYLDQTPPSRPKVLINSGNRYTNEPHVNLKISAIGAYEMKISDKPDFQGAEWEKYNTIRSGWTLSPDEGVKKVYVKFRDRAGNESESSSDDIELDITPPQSASVEIITKEGKSGITNNKDGLVDLKLTSEGGRYMMISNTSTFYESKWEIFQNEVKDWHLGGGEGEKTVFVKFRDRAGNVSAPVLQKLIIDTEAPVAGRVGINRTDTYCATDTVSLYLFARGATEMAISQNGDFSSAEWIPYVNTLSRFTLLGDDGTKVVSVKFRDEAGNESEVYSDDIILDRKAPWNCQFSINRGDTITNNPYKMVVLQIKAQGADQMRIGVSADFLGAKWQNYSDQNLNFVLPGVDGPKDLYIQFRDHAGNISETLHSWIRLDRSPPREGKVSINEGDKGTNEQDVTLTIEAIGAKEMVVSNTYTFDGAAWEPYATSKKWTLKGEDGLKSVFVRFRDKAGNISKIAAARIGIDRSAPTEGKMMINKGAPYCTNINKYVNVSLYAKDASAYMISNSPRFDSASWIPLTLIHENFMLDGEDGEKEVFVKFKDQVGNESTPISQKIILDREAPMVNDFLANGGDAYTNKHQIMLDISAEGAKEMIISNLRSFSPPARWEPYAEKKAWVLSGNDGEKQVYIKFRDEAGNVSLVTAASIYMDTNPPGAGIVKINNGATLTKNTTVRLHFSATGADYVMISNSSKFDDSAIWQEFKREVDWVLPSEPGFRRIYVKFKDKCNNETAPIFSEITVESM